MKQITVVGIDLAKSVFQVQGNDASGRAQLKRKLSRSDLGPFAQQLAPTVIAMEACSGAHFLARKFRDYGHEVKLIAPQFVKPFVQGNKNDAADAAAICEAAVRPSMRFVTIKPAWHLDVQAIHRVRNRLVQNRTALGNEMRGILAEAGFVVARGITTIERFATSLLHDDQQSLTPMCKQTIADLVDELKTTAERIAVNDRRLEEIAKSSDACKRIREISGVGVIVATAIIAAAPEPQSFKNGRQFAAWLGLVPKHSGTGGKNRLGAISKRGDRYIRCLLVHGARSSLRTAAKRNDRVSRWAENLRESRGYNKAAVALANKNARMIWALLAKGQEYKRIAA